MANSVGMANTVTRPVLSMVGIYSALLLVALATAGLAHWPPAEPHTSTVLALAMLGLALYGVRRDPNGPDGYGIALGGLLLSDNRSEGTSKKLGIVRALREFGVAVGVSIAVLLPATYLYRWWWGLEGSFQLDLSGIHPSVILGQWVVIAIPEEVFFRGFVQTRLEQHWSPRHRVLGVTISWPALLIQSGLFALIHLAHDPDLRRLAVFLPGLLFGWVRSWRGGVGAAAWVHAICNICAGLWATGWPHG